MKQQAVPLPEVKRSKKNSRITLEKWVRDNDRLLEVTGVFGAITAYFSQLPNQKVGYVLSLVSLLAFLLLLYEVLGTFPEHASVTLTGFQFALVGIFAMSGVYVVVTYWAILLDGLFLVIALTYWLAVSALIRRFQIFTKLRSNVDDYTSRHKSLKPMARLGFQAIFFLSGLAVGLVTSQYIIGSLVSHGLLSYNATTITTTTTIART